MVMRVYLIRHAESELNARRVHQVGTVGLSALGERQAGLLARRLGGVPIDALLSSPYERARRTAERVGAAIGVPVELTPLLVELKRPTEIEGLSYDDPHAVAVKAAIASNGQRPDWRYGDEETFWEARERARRLLAAIEGREANAIALVTHGGFITLLLAVMLHGDALDPGQFTALRAFLHLDNTGITTCQYGIGSTGARWQLFTWNDRAHLACPTS